MTIRAGYNYSREVNRTRFSGAASFAFEVGTALDRGDVAAAKYSYREWLSFDRVNARSWLARRDSALYQEIHGEPYNRDENLRSERANPFNKVCDNGKPHCGPG